MVVPGHAGRIMLFDVYNKSFENVVKGVYPFNVGMVPEANLACSNKVKGEVELVFEFPKYTITVILRAAQCFRDIIERFRIISNPS